MAIGLSRAHSSWLAILLGAFAAAGFTLLTTPESEPLDVYRGPPPRVSSAPPAIHPFDSPASTAKHTNATPGYARGAESSSASDSSLEDEASDAAPRPVDQIKQTIYALEIDSVDDLYQLDALVDLGETEPPELWNTEWSGADDFKRYRDGFRLETWSDGRYVFIPGEEKRTTYMFYEDMGVYEYDELHREFVSEIDYYGKKIRSVIKFLRQDVAVTMVVSGDKVDLNVYEFRPDPPEP